ncbi:MAG: 16S rRNA (cytosine(967)-C(5))-methyltransferase RsmB [Gammaproteobacteria bacterium]
MAADPGVLARHSAADAVAAVAQGESLADALPPLLQALPERDRGLAQELAYGTVRWRVQLDALLEPLLARRPSNAYIAALLAVGLYQLRRTRIPEHAAVSATVAAAPQRLRGLVNAVLRNAQRRAAELDAAIAEDPVAQSAHPRWLLDRLRHDWPDDWAAVVAANNEPAPMTLRARDDRDAYLEMLAAARIPAVPAPHAPTGVVLADAVAVSRLPGFSEGRVSVQDAAAQLAAGLLDAAPGSAVLDACAAPGGKTCHILEREPTVALTAVEIDAQRALRIDESLERLGLAARVVVADAAQPDGWWDGVPFDRILLDAPCSATGVIRRHPDIRALRRPSDIAALVKRQRTLLAALWTPLADGGRLVYATCSVLRAENDDVVAAFVAANADARIEPIDTGWGRQTDYGRQILPGQDGMDGFYYACLRKGVECR